jgi:hypothetical protein
MFRIRHVASPDEAAKFNLATGLPAVSGHTIARARQAEGLHSFTMQRKPLLTPARKASRLEWAVTRREMTATDWRRVAFSDETYINRPGTSPSLYKWCRSDDDFAARRVNPKARFGGGVITILAAISFNGLRSLVAIEGDLSAASYITILQQNLMPLVHRHFPDGNAIFTQDSAPCHAAGATI